MGCCLDGGIGTAALILRCLLLCSERTRSFRRRGGRRRSEKVRGLASGLGCGHRWKVCGMLMLSEWNTFVRGHWGSWRGDVALSL